MSLVSIIIPCYNAQRWVAEAVDSCLAQTYAPIEIIVVDDGSTDDSIGVLRSYGERIRLVQQTHAGGSWARNHGFALSQGELIQYLDADDYLLPEKIATQVTLLQETGADVVYGDWRHEYCREEGTRELGPVNISDTHDDVLAALLGGWWTANLTLLFRRTVVERAGGWDESLAAGQDRDFFLSVALTGAGIRYQPGCHSIYRRYGNYTVSTANQRHWLEGHIQLLEKAEHKLLVKAHQDNMATYTQALALSYFNLARISFHTDREKYRPLLQKALQLDPQFRVPGSPIYRTFQRLLGFEAADRLAQMKHSITELLRSGHGYAI